MDKTYDLEYGLYRRNGGRDYLKQFNITAKVEGLAPHYKDAHPRLQSYVGKEFIIKREVYGGFIIFDGKEDNHLPTDFLTLKFSTPDCPNLDIDKFLRAIRTADISKDFRQVF